MQYQCYFCKAIKRHYRQQGIKVPPAYDGRNRNFSTYRGPLGARKDLQRINQQKFIDAQRSIFDDERKI